MKWGGGRKTFFWGSVQSDGERRKEKYIARTLLHLNLTDQTNASIESLPGTSQPQRSITSVPRLDINYIMSRHSFDKAELT